MLLRAGAARHACWLAARSRGAAALAARPPPAAAAWLRRAASGATRSGASVERAAPAPAPAPAPAERRRAGAQAEAAGAGAGERPPAEPAGPSARGSTSWANQHHHQEEERQQPRQLQAQPPQPEQSEARPAQQAERSAYRQSPRSQRPTLEALATPRQPVVVAALYKFVELLDHEALREALEKQCAELGILGTLLLAREGINLNVAGPRASVDKLLVRLRADPRLSDLVAKQSLSTVPPFLRLKVKVKPEIVTMGVPGVDPTRQRGTYVAPRDWNALIASPDVLLVDTRNAMEVKLGAFEGALDPGTATFRELPHVLERLLEGKPKDTKVAMYCTGGVRCEKSTSLLRLRGFTDVYHLEGGILKYLEEVPHHESKFRGECYVFDERVTVDHGLHKGSFEGCKGCLHPLTEQDRASPHFKRGVHCPHCVKTLSEPGLLRRKARQRQIDLAMERGERHIGQVYEPMSKREARRRIADETRAAPSGS